MPTLRVLGRYRSNFGSYEVGQVLHLDDEDAAWLLRDSPGSFALAGAAEAPPLPALASREADSEDDEDSELPGVGAMSTETASGLLVPDRRYRGGFRRREVE